MLPPARRPVVRSHLSRPPPPYLRKRLGSGRIDYLGIIYVAVAVGLLQIVLGRGGRAGWFDAAWVRYFTAATVVSAVLLGIHELRLGGPGIALRSFKGFRYTPAGLLLSFQLACRFRTPFVHPLVCVTVA